MSSLWLHTTVYQIMCAKIEKGWGYADYSPVSHGNKIRHCRSCFSNKKVPVPPAPTCLSLVQMGKLRKDILLFCLVCLVRLDVRETVASKNRPLPFQNICLYLYLQHLACLGQQAVWPKFGVSLLILFGKGQGRHSSPSWEALSDQSLLLNIIVLHPEGLRIKASSAKSCPCLPLHPSQSPLCHVFILTSPDVGSSSNALLLKPKLPPEIPRGPAFSC